MNFPNKIIYFVGNVTTRLRWHEFQTVATVSIGIYINQKTQPENILFIDQTELHEIMKRLLLKINEINEKCLKLSKRLLLCQ